MASRENQGLQIALILFVMITVALGVTTYVFWDKSKTLAKEKQDALADKKKAEADTSTKDLEVRFLKSTIGFDDLQTPTKAQELEQLRTSLRTNNQKISDEVEAIQKAFEQDMALFDPAWVSANGGDSAKNWVNLAKSIEFTIANRNAKIDEGLEREKAIAAAQKTAVDAANVQTTEARKGRQTAEDTQAADLVTYNDDRSKFVTTTTALQTDVTKKGNETVQVRKDLEAKLAAKDVEINNLNQDKQALVSQIRKLQNKDLAAVPDGEITSISQRSRTVTINLGLSDGLHRQTTFNVYDEEVGDLTTAVPKAKIEVTRLVDQNLAEARILEDSLADPILPHDKIYTSAWAPGRNIKFALAGNMPNRDAVRNLILLNGGEITAEVTDNGEYIGSLSYDTRYLIRGDAPLEGPAADAFNAIYSEAQSKGIEIMNYDKMLEYMGHRSEVKTVPLGRRGAETFEDSSGDFRKRYPDAPPRGAGGAFP